MDENHESDAKNMELVQLRGSLIQEELTLIFGKKVSVNYVKTLK